MKRNGWEVSADAKRPKMAKERKSSRSMHSVTSKECKQKAGSKVERSARGSGSKKQQSETTKANFVEDDQIVEIEMQGQNTEFASDVEQAINLAQESSDEDEVIFNVSSQGNVTLIEFFTR